MERDPVCGMSVDPANAAAKIERAGKTFFFCAMGCAARFEKEPKKYLADGRVTGTSSEVMSIAPAAQMGAPAVRPPDRTAPCCSHAAAPSAAQAPPSKAGARYTCPMHPEIVKDGPGACPICGMALEPM